MIPANITPPKISLAMSKQNFPPSKISFSLGRVLTGEECLSSAAISGCCFFFVPCPFMLLVLSYFVSKDARIKRISRLWRGCLFVLPLHIKVIFCRRQLTPVLLGNLPDECLSTMLFQVHFFCHHKTER